MLIPAKLYAVCVLYWKNAIVAQVHFVQLPCWLSVPGNSNWLQLPNGAALCVLFHGPPPVITLCQKLISFYWCRLAVYFPAQFVNWKSWRCVFCKVVTLPVRLRVSRLVRPHCLVLFRGIIFGFTGVYVSSYQFCQDSDLFDLCWINHLDQLWTLAVENRKKNWVTDTFKPVKLV